MSKKKEKNSSMSTHTPKRSNKKSIDTLQKENHRLRRQVEALKRELAEQKGEPLSDTAQTKSERFFKNQAINGALYNKKGILAYLYGWLRHSVAFRLYLLVFTYLRRFRFLTYTIAIFSYVLVFIEAAALLLLSTSALVIALPLSLAISQFLLFCSRSDRKKANRINKQLLKNKQVILFFPPRRGLSPHSFLAGMAREYAAKPDTVSILVSPFLLSARGISMNERRYWVERIEDERILLIRRSYYFTLKKKFFGSVCTDITEIH